MQRNVKPKVGKPLLFKTPQELQIAIDKYIKDCEEHTIQIFNEKTMSYVKQLDPKTPTIAGIAFALNMDRQTFYNYSERNEYFDTIKKARDYVVSKLEDKMMNSKTQVAGAIFIAKNYGYVDKQEVNTNQTVNIISNPKDENLL